jgi:hypothetical protein
LDKMKRAAHVHWGLVLGHASPLLCVRSYRNVRGCGLRAGKAKLGIRVCVRQALEADWIDSRLRSVHAERVKCILLSGFVANLDRGVVASRRRRDAALMLLRCTYQRAYAQQTRLCWRRRGARMWLATLSFRRPRKGVPKPFSMSPSQLCLIPADQTGTALY